MIAQLKTDLRPTAQPHFVLAPDLLGEYRPIPENIPYVTFCLLDPNMSRGERGAWRELDPVPANEASLYNALEEVMTCYAAHYAVYVQQSFSTAAGGRKKASVFTHLSLDLDIYESKYAGADHQTLVRAAYDRCDEIGLPYPTTITSSGRGIYLKWALTEQTEDAAEWKRMTKCLIRAFASFGADRKCSDAARVLRLVGSTNFKGGATVQHIAIHQKKGLAAAYEFEELSNVIRGGVFDTPITERKQRSRAKAPAGPLEGVRVVLDGQGGHFANPVPRPSLGNYRSRKIRHLEARRMPDSRARSYCTWFTGLLHDYQTLAADRYSDGVVTEGNRDIFAHLIGCAVAYLHPAREFWMRVHALVSWILPVDYIEDEMPRHLQPIYERAVEFEKEGYREWNGRLVNPVYFYSKESLLEILQVSRDEQERLMLWSLVSDAESDRRWNVKRRSTGRDAKEQKQARKDAADQAVDPILRMREEGMSWPRIATELGLSEGAARKRFERFANRNAPAPVIVSHGAQDNREGGVREARCIYRYTPKAEICRSLTVNERKAEPSLVSEQTACAGEAEAIQAPSIVVETLVEMPEPLNAPKEAPEARTGGFLDMFLGESPALPSNANTALQEALAEYDARVPRTRSGDWFWKKRKP